jgi:TolB protein
VKGITFVFALLLAQGLLAAPAPPVGPPRHLLVVSGHSGNYEIYLVKPDERETRNLTSHKAADTEAVWSHDGSRIAFVSNRDGTANIWTMKPDGKDVQQVTASKAPCSSPRWSPDGKTIAYVARGGNGIDQVWITDIGGKGPKQLTSDRFPSRQPAWAPKGDRLSFSRYGPGLYDTHVISADGGGETNLTGGSGGLDAQWSPDGSKIAFTSTRSGRGFLVYVMDADGKNVKEVASNPNTLGNVYPVWSPDGKRIAFADWVAGALQLAAVDADGKNLTHLTKEGTNWNPQWSPDGKTIAFLKSDSQGGVWITSIDGKTQREVMRGASSVSWRPGPPKK